MAKYGRGMRIEVTEGILKGKLKEPISSGDIKAYMNVNEWYPEDTYINVFLSNSSSVEHSLSYSKVFKRVSEGKYELIRKNNND
jgi:hypothetical protein